MLCVRFGEAPVSCWSGRWNSGVARGKDSFLGAKAFWLPRGSGSGVFTLENLGWVRRSVCVVVEVVCGVSGVSGVVRGVSR
ncbi:hypothetical protein GIB67_004836 [Kingdonia uniflora]|uniref:Uncharacterized protein n=1 Tax=Kingdonia uniflora TaxID=39325 RepID=A0A7J7LNF7_9MAGN|nr:hypothetical protein GIB67_004836 [Kingdonia uniflora]